MDTLCSSISKTRCKNAVDFRHFFPSHRVREVMASESVRKVLLDSQMEMYHVNEAVEIIKNGAWNVFAILVLIKQPRRIVSFIEDDRMQRGPIDHHLPFELTKLEELLDPMVAQDFHDKQWEFTAPSFSGSVFTRILPDDFVLPFLSDKELGEGSFGTVHRIQVERSYQQFGREPYHEVVRKEFKPQRKKAEYELELRNLSILRLLKHPSIVELLGSYTYRGKHNLIFPLARGGTLADLLKCARPPAFQSDENIVLALSGLCSAVRATHYLFSEDEILTRIGCHHDLKPHNVLVDNATFLLADFGLSRFKELTEGSATSYKYVGGCYVAPECEDFSVLDETKRTHTIGRSSDIWSLGCIMMEILLYMKSGAAGVQKFEDERSYRFGQITLHRFHHGPHEEEPAVAMCLTGLWNNASTRSERLLIELIKHVLQLDPSARPKAEELERRMRFIAIDTIAQQINLLYAGICREGSSPQAFIERMQFESWMEACESLYTYKDLPLSYHWKSPSYAEYQSTLECLRELQNTLDAPSIELQNRPMYQAIERLNDILLQSRRSCRLHCLKF